MTTHRRYSKATKVAAILAADASTPSAAADATGIPRQTLSYWLDKPEFADLRRNAREAMKQEWVDLARLGLWKLVEAVVQDKLEPRDLIIAVGMAFDKAQLANGGATGRVETKDITETLDDHERAALLAAIEREVSARHPVDGAAAGDQEAAAMADRAPAGAGGSEG